MTTRPAGLRITVQRNEYLTFNKNSYFCVNLEHKRATLIGAIWEPLATILYSDTEHDARTEGAVLLRKFADLLESYGDKC